ncbi:hypothetical protein EYF80_044513 [Liparis tanakae]|uniref:Uncharacterized protein n=1 Tax=Liparis tanakae TaxID=230148 RepID=A0A4Z2FWY9_9TELE|nr:hypothetical protein EYF80_044513 [Liparis tanakae]
MFLLEERRKAPVQLGLISAQLSARPAAAAYACTQPPLLLRHLGPSCPGIIPREAMTEFHLPPAQVVLSALIKFEFCLLILSWYSSLDGEPFCALAAAVHAVGGGLPLWRLWLLPWRLPGGRRVEGRLRLRGRECCWIC